MTLSQKAGYEVLRPLLVEGDVVDGADELGVETNELRAWLQARGLHTVDWSSGLLYRQRPIVRHFIESPLTQAEIADIFGVSQGTLSTWSNRLGLNERPWTDSGRLRTLYEDEGLSDEAIATRWGCTPKTIRNWLDEHGIERHRVDEIHVPDRVQDAVDVQTGTAD